MKRLLWLIVAAVSLWAGPAAAESDDAEVVGRITEITGGELLRYDVDASEWIPLVPDAPFGIDDALYTDERARAEIVIPNGTLLRMDGYTQILTLSLDDRLTHLQLSDGLIRVTGRPDGADVEVQTAFGRVRVPPGGIGDIAVDDEGATATAVDGIVEILTQGGESYTLQQGESLSFREGEVASVAASPSSSWADWNRARDRIWEARRQDTASGRYLPTPLSPYAHELDDYGEWRRVYYSGGYHWLWHPTRVAVGWSPFTHGRWVTWYGDPTWIPSEPFGYVTHHYGSWEFLGGLWFWVPPGLGVSISLGPHWYPGRVGWVSYGGFIGWYPLLWHEPWYSHRHWGPHSYSYARYRYVRHHHASRLVAVEYRHFYRSRSYAEHRQRFDNHSRFKPHRGPNDLPALKGDRHRFYTKGTPAVRMPSPNVTRAVAQRIETKRQRPDMFRPATVRRYGPPSQGGREFSGPRPDSRTVEVDRARPDRTPERRAPFARPDRLDQRKAPDIRQRRIGAPPAAEAMKPMPSPPGRFGGGTSTIRRPDSAGREKAPRPDVVRPGLHRDRERPSVTRDTRQMGSPAPAVRELPRQGDQSRSTAPEPRRRLQAPPVASPPSPSQTAAGSSALRRGSPSRTEAQSRPRIFPAPPETRMQRPAVSSPPVRRSPESPSSRQFGSSRTERPEHARISPAPQRSRMQAPAMSPQPTRRPSVSAPQRRDDSPRRALEERPNVSSPSLREQPQRRSFSRPQQRGGPFSQDREGLK